MTVLWITEASQERDTRLKVHGDWAPSFSQTKYHLQSPGAVTSLFSTNKFMVSAKWQVQGRKVWYCRAGLLPQFFVVRLLFCLTSKTGLCALEILWSPLVNTLKHTSMTPCLLLGSIAKVQLELYPATKHIYFTDLPSLRDIPKSSLSS